MSETRARARGVPVGTFSVEVRLAHPARPGGAEPLKLLVDTDSAYTWVSGVLLQRLGLAPSTSPVPTCCTKSERRAMPQQSRQCSEGKVASNSWNGTSRRVITLQGQVIERPAAEVLLTLDGQSLHTLCPFGEPGELEVLGAITLEQFGLAVDPVQRRLVPAVLYGA